MDFLTDRLSEQYGSFPEAVIFLYAGQILYSNEAGQALLKKEDFPQDLLPALAEHPGGMEIALGKTFYFVTVSQLQEGDLLVLRDLDPPPEKKHPFSNAVYRMRECLSNLSATQWKMQQVLEDNGLLDGLEQDLANQNRLVFQMLRLTRQAELTQELNYKSFPREEGFDLAMVCQGMADEATWLADLAAWLEGGKPARSFDFDESDDAVKAARKELGLLSAKPVIYACNVGEDDLLGGLDENPYFPLVAARAKEENAQAIPICAKTEEDIAGSTQEEKIAFLQEMGIESTGLDKLIKASYELLGLISFLTDGKKECRAWTIRKGTKAPQAAGKIHSDFERGFIRAQVIAYKDLEDADFNYAAVKAKGLQRTEGKEYVVNDGDVIEFLFNV